LISKIEAFSLRLINAHFPYFFNYYINLYVSPFNDNSSSSWIYNLNFSIIQSNFYKNININLIWISSSNYLYWRNTNYIHIFYCHYPKSKFFNKTSHLFLTNNLNSVLFFSDPTLWISTVIDPENNQKLITSFFYPSQGPILIAIILILFFALLLVVKIAERNKGPFRPFTKYEFTYS